MLTLSDNTSQRQSLVRVARQRHAVVSRRSFIAPTAVRQGKPSLRASVAVITNSITFLAADLVQEMYLRELKNYKPPQVKQTDAEGHVQKFNMPKPPPSPEESDIANELKTYETQQVDIEGQSSEGGSAVVEEDWFEEEEDEAHAVH